MNISEEYKAKCGKTGENIFLTHSFWETYNQSVSNDMWACSRNSTCKFRNECRGMPYGKGEHEYWADLERIKRC